MRASAALLLLPFAFWISTSGRTSAARAPVNTRLTEQTMPTRFSVVAAFFGAGVFSALLVASLFWLWTQYDRGTPALTASPGEGELYVFFDRPGVLAAMQVGVASAYWTDAAGSAADDLLVSITVRDLAPGESVGYVVSLAGTALPSATYPEGEEQELDHRGCPPAVSQSVQDCDLVRGDPEGWPFDDDAAEDTMVLAGTITNDDESNPDASTSFWIASSGRTAIQNGELLQFQLPRIGRAWLPDEYVRTQAFVLGARTQLFVPEKLAIAVTYEELSATESLDAVEPVPITRQPLAWVEGEISSIAPSGTILNTRVERDAERNVFVIGVLAGVLVGLVPSVFISWRHAIALAAKRARSTTR